MREERGAALAIGYLDSGGTRCIQNQIEKCDKKRMATARRLIFFGISQGIHC
jgi:hypothetical protein